MLKWAGDFTLPRLRAKLANKYALHPDCEPDYAETYRPDLSMNTIIRKDSSGFLPGGNSTWASTRTPMGLSSSLDRTGGGTRRLPLSSTATSSRSSLQASSKDLPGLTRVASVPTLGTQRAQRAPAALAPPPPGMKRDTSQPMLHKHNTHEMSTMSLSADDKRALEKEQLVEQQSRRLWTTSGGAELYIREMLTLQKSENPGISFQDLTKKMANTPVPAMLKSLKNGAKIDYCNPDWDGATLLLKAVRTNSLPLAMYMISKGADGNMTDNSGRGVLHWSAAEGDPEMMEYFLGMFPDLQTDLADEGGDFPLHLAAYHGHLPLVRLLIQAGADPALTNSSGFTASELAQGRRQWHVANYLNDVKQQEEDRANKEGQLIQDLLRPCNRARADEVRTEWSDQPKVKPLTMGVI